MKAFRYHIFILIVFSLASFCLALGALPLLDPDEARYAETARQMYVTGDYIVPHFNGQLRLEKPAFFHWFVAGSFKLFGVNEIAARLPSAFFGLCGVLVTYFFARKLFDARVGFLSALILTSSLGYLILSRLSLLETLLTLSITSTVIAFWWWYRYGQKPVALITMYCSMGIGLLIKGPIGLLEPLLIISIFILFSRQPGLFKRLGLWWGVALAVVIASPWYYLCYIKSIGLDAALAMLREETSGRFFGGFIHKAHLLYYVPVLAGGLFPWWTVLIIGRQQPVEVRAHAVMCDQREATRFLMLWALTVFIFFSLSQSKVATYVLPLFIPVAILLAQRWASLFDHASQWSRGRRSLPFGLMLCVWIVIAFGAQFFLDQRYPGTSQVVWPVTLGAVIGGSSIFIIAFRGKIWRAFSMNACLVIVFMWTLIHYAGPTFGVYRSTKQLSLRLAPLLNETDHVVTLGFRKPSAVFYLKRTVERVTVDELKPLLARGERVFCYIKNDAMKNIAEEVGYAYEIASRGQRLTVVAFIN